MGSEIVITLVKIQIELILYNEIWKSKHLFHYTLQSGIMHLHIIKEEGLGKNEKWINKEASENNWLPLFAVYI